MIIAVISDTHDNIDYFKKFMEKIKNKKIEAVIHCGDLIAPFMVKFLKELNLTVYLTNGNNLGDMNSLSKQIKDTKITYYPRVGEITLAGKKIAFTHFPKIADELASTGVYDYVFYGHTHEKKEGSVSKTILINPGELTNLKSKGSFVILNLSTGKYEFIDL